MTLASSTKVSFLLKSRLECKHFPANKVCLWAPCAIYCKWGSIGSVHRRHGDPIWIHHDGYDLLYCWWKGIDPKWEGRPYKTTEAAWIPQNMTWKGTEVTLIWGFADLCFSGVPPHQQPPPLIPGKIDRIVISVDPFLVKMTGT